MTTEEAVAEFEAQGALNPGEEGWWKVWGARARDIRVGDLMASKVGEEIVYDLIDDTFLAQSSPLRVGLSSNGKRFTIGSLAPIVLFRKGNKNTLAGSVR